MLIMLIQKACQMILKNQRFPYCPVFETFEERPILAKYKEGDNFKRRNTLSISSIEI